MRKLSILALFFITSSLLSPIYADNTIAKEDLTALSPEGPLQPKDIPPLSTIGKMPAAPKAADSRGSQNVIQEPIAPSVIENMQPAAPVSPPPAAATTTPPPAVTTPPQSPGTPATTVQPPAAAAPLQQPSTSTNTAPAGSPSTPPPAQALPQQSAVPPSQQSLEGY